MLTYLFFKTNLVLLKSMIKKLKIAQLAPPYISVPPKKYGGTELIVYYLCQELTKRGHNVTLFASGDSKTSATLEWVFKKELYSQKINWQDPFYPLLHATLIFKKNYNFDIIHNHFHYFGLCFCAGAKTPFLTTYHGDFLTAEKNPAKYEILNQFKNTNFISISNAQRKTTSIKLNFIKTIYNGIDIKKFEFSPKKGKYLAYLGRITPKKGILEAIEIAKKTNLPLKIAAKIDKNLPADIEFFEKKVKPLLKDKKIKYIGEITQNQKSSFLKNAIALLNPIQWEEPFGLVMVESMACGTPVIAFNRGSVPEVVKDKKTGFVVNNINEAVKAVKKIDQIKREDCRKWVEEKFTVERMVDEYEKVYYEVLKKSKSK